METGIETKPPETLMGVKPRFSYRHLIDRIAAAAPGTWVQIDPNEIDGDHSAIKQSRLHQASHHRGIKITTTSRVKGWIYARVLTAADSDVPR